MGSLWFLFYLKLKDLSRLLFQARDRLPSLTEEIMRIGSDGVPSEPERGSNDDALQSLTTEGGHADVSSLGISSKDKKDKEIEDYPRPLAVVGVSVL